MGQTCRKEVKRDRIPSVPFLKAQLLVSGQSSYGLTQIKKKHIRIICYSVLVSYDPLNNLPGIFYKVVTKKSFIPF